MIFDAVARHQSMSRAARELDYTQPAISHAIRRLERDVGTALLTRGARGVALTEAGERLAAHAQVVLTVMRAARRELDELATAITGRVRLAAFPSAAAMIVPPLLSRVHALRPGLNVELVHAEPDEALRMVTNGDADIAMAFAYPNEAPAPGIRVRALFDDPVRAVVPASEETADPPFDLVGLRERAWIAGCPRCRTHLVNVCHRHGFAPHIVHATDDYVAAQAMVAAGLGVTLLPALALAAYRHPGVAVHDLEPRSSRKVSACTVDTDPLPPAVALVFGELATLEAPGRAARE